jgi:hypothetical protein
MSDYDSSPLKEITENAALVHEFGWLNYGLGWVVAIISVISSIASSIMVALGVPDRQNGESAVDKQRRHKKLVAILAAVPAAAVTITTTFHFEQRGITHFDTEKQLNGLARQLKYENASDADVSRKYSHIDLTTFRGWMPYGTFGQGRLEPPSKTPESNDQQQHDEQKTNSLRRP